MPTIKNEQNKTVEITQAQHDELFEKKGKAFRAEREGEYWFLDSYGEIEGYTETNSCGDNYRYLTGNYFQTEEECKAHKTLLEATGRVTHAIKDANGDWEASKKQDKHVFYFTDEKIQIDTLLDDVFYCEKLPYMKPDTAEKILEEHEEDLKVIFGV